MTDTRFEAVYQAASALFIKQGYASTQVSHIAKEAKIATGTVYNLFAGKKAILTFVVYHTLMEKNLEASIPFAEVEEDLMVKRLKEIVGPFLEELRKKDASNVPLVSFEDLLSKLFDLVAKYHKAFSIINDHKKELKALEHVYRSYVEDLYQIILEHLSIYKKHSDIRDIAFPELHIRNILEGITWWAMYVPYQDQNDQVKLTIDQAKEQALLVLTKGYMKN
jgi:AcrR family transcriptional regulator